jgi:argininosuccinate lyase
VRQKKQTIWGGRFTAKPNEKVRVYTQSYTFDSRLYRQDIQGSLAHAKMLKKIGLLTAKELSEIQTHLQTIQQHIETGKFPWRAELEDVHMNLEVALTQRTPAGEKLHTGRSRNDQVATDMRLWLKEEILAHQQLIRRLQKTLLSVAQKNKNCFIPGYTHLQRAQTVSLAHHFLAYVEMLERDLSRLKHCYDITNYCPLGAGALAGSTLPLDREFVARELGFIDKQGKARLIKNSMDAVSDRDFVVQFLSASALTAVHLSRLAEDLLLWSSAEFNFIQLSDTFTTGSSLMPQKKNPDVAELARGKTGRVIGNLLSVLITLKGLPMTYNRDLQEDKERLFDTADTLRLSLDLFADMLSQLKINSAACQAAIQDPNLLATDLADALVQQRLPFRQAHHLVGSAVAYALRSQKTLRDLSDQEWRTLHPAFLKIKNLLNQPTHKQLQSKKTLGSPNPKLVEKEIARWQKKSERA